MSDLGNDIPQEIPTRKTEGDFNLIVVCSVLIIAVAVITVYYLTEKDERICCNFAQELNITTKLAEIEIRLENLHKSLEKEMQRESEGTDLFQIIIFMKLNILYFKWYFEAAYY